MSAATGLSFVQKLQSRVAELEAAKERQIGIVNLEDARYVRICCSVGLDTNCALRWVEEIIRLKRQELAELAALSSEGVT
jgi:hypothetical protein